MTQKFPLQKIKKFCRNNYAVETEKTILLTILTKKLPSAFVLFAPLHENVLLVTYSSQLTQFFSSPWI